MLRLAATFSLVLLTGCVARGVPDVRFCDAASGDCLSVADGVEYPDVTRDTPDATCSLAPRSVADGEPTEFWELSLAETMRLALQNSPVLRDLGARVLDSPQLLSSVFDPAIAQSHPRFGEEAALAAFDANLNQSFIYSDSDLPFNNSNVGGGAFEVQRDQFRWNGGLNKTAATGAQMGLNMFTNHDHSDAPANLFSHAWTNGLEATIRQPLLQGAGVTFNRIAGPNGVPDVSLTPGVLLARINTDVRVADFERGVRDFVDQVESAYWRLYLAYRTLDASRLARDKSRETWQAVKSRYDAGLRGGEADQEAQAREQLYSFEQQVLLALDGDSSRGASQFGVYPAERQLRQLMGQPVSDGRLIRPLDEPTEARVEFDWDCSLLDALARRVELRRQLWAIKQRELELIASKNFLLPRLDAIASFRTEGLGDDLFGRTASFESSVNELFSYQHYEVVAGLQFSVPIGFRREFAGVRHAELNLCRERAILREQEKAIAHELGESIADVVTTYQNTQLAYNRLVAAEQVVDARTAAFDAGKVTIDSLLEALRRSSQARVDYFASRTAHVTAIKNVHRSKGTLLPYNGIQLSEGPSSAAAGNYARERRIERLIDYRFTKPCPISLGKMDNTIDLTRAADEQVADQQAHGEDYQPSLPLAAGQAATDGINEEYGTNEELFSDEPPIEDPPPQPLTPPRLLMPPPPHAHSNREATLPQTPAQHVPDPPAARGIVGPETFPAIQPNKAHRIPAAVNPGTRAALTAFDLGNPMEESIAKGEFVPEVPAALLMRLPARDAVDQPHTGNPSPKSKTAARAITRHGQDSIPTPPPNVLPHPPTSPPSGQFRRSSKVADQFGDAYRTVPGLQAAVNAFE